MNEECGKHCKQRDDGYGQVVVHCPHCHGCQELPPVSYAEAFRRAVERHREQAG